MLSIVWVLFPIYTSFVTSFFLIPVVVVIDHLFLLALVIFFFVIVGGVHFVLGFYFYIFGIRVYTLFYISQRLR